MSEIISAGLTNTKEESFFRNRLIFPIENINGDVVGFSGRTLDSGESKYINSPETSMFSKSKILYNFHNARESIYKNKEVIITEGFFDVIALETVGFKNVVAIMGTALTINHLYLLKDFKVTLMLDSDSAGINSMKKSIVLLLKNKNIVNIVINEEHLDPEEYLRKFGKDKLLKLIDNKKDGFLFLANWFKNNKNLDDPNILNDVLNKLATIIPHDNVTIFNIYKNKLAAMFNVSDEILNDVMKHISFENDSNHNYAKKPQKEVKREQKSINYSNILMWCLLNNDEFPKLYLEANPLIVDENGIQYKEIAKLHISNPEKIKVRKKEFLAKHQNFDKEKKYNKNEFFDIIVTLSIQSLEILANELLCKLENIDKNNIEETKTLTSRWRTVNKKIKVIKKERKNA